MAYKQVTAQNEESDKKSVMELVSAVDKASMLVSLVNDSMLRAASSLEKLKKNIVEESKCCSPTIISKLNELKSLLEDVLRKCHTYCDACKDLGDYGSDEDVIKSITDEIKSDKFDKVQDFIGELHRFVQICETRLQRCTDAESAAKKEFASGGEEFQRKRDEAMASQRKNTIASGVTGSTAEGVKVVGAFLTFFSPPAGILAMFAAIATGATATGITIDAGYTQAQIAIFNDACQAVINLDSNLNEAMKIAKDMGEKIYSTTTSGFGIDGLEKSFENGKSKKIEHVLPRLKEKMLQISRDSTDLKRQLPLNT